MPRIKSAKKRMRQTKVRTAATPAEAAEALKGAESALDRAGRKNLVHRNTAARTKSRLAKAANKVAKA